MRACVRACVHVCVHVHVCVRARVRVCMSLACICLLLHSVPCSFSSFRFLLHLTRTQVANLTRQLERLQAESRARAAAAAAAAPKDNAFNAFFKDLGRDVAKSIQAQAQARKASQ